MTTTLGKSGLEVSTLGLGCWAIGGRMQREGADLGYANVTDDEARAGLRRALELGITLLDTSNAYGAGHSERLIGEVVGNDPGVVVATKFGNLIDEPSRELTGQDVSPAAVRQSAQDSLRRLQRDRIDLFQLHTPDIPTTQAEAVLGALEDLVTDGLIGWYGVSTDTPAQAEVIAAGPHCAALQIQLNVFDDNAPMLDFCAAHDLGVLCRSPLAMGLLGGRYDATTKLPDNDVRGKQPDWLRWFDDGRPTPGFLAALDSVRAVLTADGRTLAQGALAWIWARSPSAVPLPGFRNPIQVEENAAARDAGPLSPAEFAAVEAALGR